MKEDVGKQKMIRSDLVAIVAAIAYHRALLLLLLDERLADGGCKHGR